MRLVITEKPSVAQSIAKVIGADKRCDGYLEGNGYVVSWCVGHLVELAEPGAYDERFDKWNINDLPIMPADWQYQVTAATRKQYKILKDLMQRDDVESLIEATDAGREGELIFRLVYNQAKCEKPFERLWISSMEDEAILEGFDNLKPGTEYDALYEAALCRERADWIVGINATRLFSCLYGQTLNVGRVMTPTLALVVAREASIRAFKPEDFFTIGVKCGDISFASDRFSDEAEAKDKKKQVAASGTLKLTKVEKKDKQEKAPQLYDLTSLQREANKKLGYTAQQTLDYTQSLYEKKLCSYPRTDSRFLTDDMESLVFNLLDRIATALDIHATSEVEVKKVLNSKKVSDHHAIIPTMQIDKVDLNDLPSGEKQILLLIATRLAEAVSVACSYSETVLEAESAGVVFKAKGKQIADYGWRVISKIKMDEDSSGDEGGFEIEVTEEQILDIDSCDIKAGKTTPPKSFTDVILCQSEVWKYSRWKGDS